MTFYEAALEVLRQSARPLHYKKITELAIRDALLSHVGKTPEQTMGDRLEQELAREDESWVVRTRPGVFTLREDILATLNEKAALRDAARPVRVDDADEADDEDAEDADDDDEPMTDEVDGEEDDLDVDVEELIAEDATSNEDANEQSNDEGGRRRRRRRRGRRGSRDDRNEPAAVAVAEAAPPGAAANSDERPRRTRGDRNGQDTSERGQAAAREAREDVRGDKRDREPREDKRDREPREDKRERRDDRRTVDVTGRFDSVGEAAFAVLKAGNRKPMTAKAIAETVFQRKLVKFHTHDAAATVQAAIVADNQLRYGQGRRQVFANHGNGLWGLTEWGLSDASVQKERQIYKLVNELCDDAAAQLAELLVGLKPEAFEMVILAILDRLDYRNIRVSKRTSDGDAFFTAEWCHGFTEARVCIQVVGDVDAEVDVEDVQLLRDTLQHYGGTEGVLIHMGDVSKEAYREVKNTELARVSILDRDTLVRLMVQEGIGVRHHQVALPMVDTSFIEALKA